MTPPGHWVSIALQVAERADLPLDQNVDLLARMGVAMSDAFVGCWHDKYVYNLVRPITYIKKNIDPKWEPLLNTPPFPEYPSGHSTVSGAMDAVLTGFFGENYAFEDKTGSPDGRNPRTFKSFREAAEEAGISRLYGGIHFQSAIVRRPRAGALHRPIRQRAQDEEMTMRLVSFGLAIALGCAGVAAAFAEESAPAAPDPIIPNFVEETASAGIDSVYKGEWEYMVGGGAASFDCNDDGYPDLLLAGGEQPAKFYRNASTHGGALKFVAEQSGLELDKVSGAYPLDVDSDGIMDVVLLRVGENVAMRGLGGCRFARANDAWGFDGGDSWWTSLAATWEKGAGWPTIAVGSYVDRAEEISPWGSCTDNWLLRPEAGASKFAAPVALKPSFCPLVDAVHRLEPVGHAEPARLQRPRILRGRPGAVVESRAGQGAGALHGRGRLEEPSHLGHGHRQLRPELRRLSGLFPDQHGRQQAADAGGCSRGRRAAQAFLCRRRLPQGRHRAPALYGRRPETQHRLAYAVRGRQQ